MLTYAVINDIIGSSNEGGGESSSDWRRGDENIIVKIKMEVWIWENLNIC